MTPKKLLGWLAGLIPLGVIVAILTLSPVSRGPAPQGPGEGQPAPAAEGDRAAGPAAAGPTVGEEVSTTLPEVAARVGTGRPVIVVGLDGADWSYLDLLMRSGDMPQLARLVAEGEGGALHTLHPPLSPLVWTTMMTGVSPLEHGILDFTRFHPTSGVKEPIGSDDRRVPAIWNMVSWAGESVAILGLWATFPAESVDGLLVSDRLFSFLYQETSPPPGIVYPSSEEGWAREVLTAAKSQVGFERLRDFLPWLSEDEYRSWSEAAEPYAHPVSALRRILIETEVYHRLATGWLARHSPALTLVYIQGTDTVGHVFAPFAPPRQASVSATEYERYSGVPRLYFREIDRLLGEYRALAEEKGAVLMLVSDHGFRWQEGRPQSLSSHERATAAKWHRDQGIYLLWGPGIAASPSHGGEGGVAQVCATLLALLALPPGSGLALPPLPGTPARQLEQPIDYRAFYRPAIPSPGSSSAVVAEEEIAKLRALGYIGSDEPATAPQGVRSGGTRTAGSFNNEGLILRDQGRLEEAAAAFASALELDPDLASALWNYSDLLFAGDRDLDLSDALLIRALAHGLPEGVRFVVGRAIGYQRAGRGPRSLALLEGAVAAAPEEAELRLFRGRYRIEAGECARALEDFEAAIRLAPGNPAGLASSGVARLCLRDPQGALADFRRSLELDPNQPQIRAYVDRLAAPGGAGG